MSSTGYVSRAGRVNSRCGIYLFPNGSKYGLSCLGRKLDLQNKCGEAEAERLRLRLVTSQGSPYPSRSPRAHPSGWTRTQGLSRRDSHAPPSSGRPPSGCGTGRWLLFYDEAEIKLGRGARATTTNTTPCARLGSESSWVPSVFRARPANDKECGRRHYGAPTLFIIGGSSPEHGRHPSSGIEWCAFGGIRPVS